MTKKELEDDGWSVPPDSEFTQFPDRGFYCSHDRYPKLQCLVSTKESKITGFQAWTGVPVPGFKFTAHYIGCPISVDEVHRGLQHFNLTEHHEPAKMEAKKRVSYNPAYIWEQSRAFSGTYEEWLAEKQKN